MERDNKEIEQQEEVKPKPKYYNAKSKQYMDTYISKNKEKYRQYLSDYYKKKYELNKEEIKKRSLARYYKMKEDKKNQLLAEQLSDTQTL